MLSYLFFKFPVESLQTGWFYLKYMKGQKSQQIDKSLFFFIFLFFFSLGLEIRAAPTMKSKEMSGSYKMSGANKLGA